MSYHLDKFKLIGGILQKGTVKTQWGPTVHQPRPSIAVATVVCHLDSLGRQGGVLGKCLRTNQRHWVDLIDN